MKFNNINDEVAYKNVRAYLISAKEAYRRLQECKRNREVDAKLYSKAYNMMFNNLQSWFHYLGIMQDKLGVITQNEWPETKKLMFSNTPTMLTMWEKIVKPKYELLGHDEKILSMERGIYHFCVNTALSGDKFTKVVQEWPQQLSGCFHYKWDKYDSRFVINYYEYWPQGIAALQAGNGLVYRPRWCEFSYGVEEEVAYQFFDGLYNPTKERGQLTNVNTKAQGIFLAPNTQEGKAALNAFTLKYYNKKIQL